MLLQPEQMHKMTTISLKIVEVVILNKKSYHFVSCSACNNIYFFSAWDNSGVKWASSQQPKTDKDVENRGHWRSNSWIFFVVISLFCHLQITQPYCQKYALRRSRCLAQWDAWECSYILFQNVFCLFSHIMSCNLSIEDYYSLPIWYF